VKLRRVYRRYQEWEEIRFNMWGRVDNREEYLRKAIEFTGNYDIYGKYMLKVIKTWPVSCENALTDLSINRKAWLGHAAVALAFRCPEDITRQAWRFLTDVQQEKANEKAERAISKWEYDYRKSKKLY